MLNKAFDDFAKKEKERERIGKIIVLTIGITALISTSINILLNIQTFITDLFTSGTVDFKMILYILNFVIAILFLRGFDWVRIWFGAVMAWNAIWTTFGFFVTIRDVKWWISVVYVIMIIYCIASATLLFASRSVKEYLYVRRNG